MPIDFETDEQTGMDAAPITADTPAATEPTKGVCRVCGDLAATKHGTYCAEHRGHDARKTRSGRKPGPARPATKTPRAIADELTASFTMLGMVWQMQGPALPPEVWPLVFPDMPAEQAAAIQHPGAVLQAQAGELANAFAALAASNPRIARWLEIASSPSGYLAVGMAAFPVVTSAAVWYKQVIPAVREVSARLETENARA